MFMIIYTCVTNGLKLSTQRESRAENPRKKGRKVKAAIETIEGGATQGRRVWGRL